MKELTTMWREVLLTALGVNIFLLPTLVFAQERSIPVAAAIVTNETDTTEKPKPVLTGDPQKDYIHDPNLPFELNGYDLSDYPFFSRLPKDMHNFSCEGRHDGFYASIPHKCQVYHHCLFDVRYDFLCANYTAFDQSNFICHFASVVDCKHSELHYYRNEALYVDPTTTPPPPPKVKIIYRDKPRPKPSQQKKPGKQQQSVKDDYYYYYDDSNNVPGKKKKEDSFYYYDESPTSPKPTTTPTTTTVKTTSTEISIRKRFPNLTRQRTRQGLENIPRAHGLGGEPNQAHGVKQLRRRPGRRRPGGKRTRRKKTTTTTTTAAPEYYDYYDDDEYYYYYDDEVPSSSTTTTTTTAKPPARKRRPASRRRRPRPSSPSRNGNSRAQKSPPVEETQLEHPGPRGGQPFRDAPEDIPTYDDIPTNPQAITVQLEKEVELQKEDVEQVQPNARIRRPPIARRSGAFRRATILRPDSAS